MSYCSVITPTWHKIHTRSPTAARRSETARSRSRVSESGSRFVDLGDQWTFQCEIQKRHPLRDETSTDETTPKPDRPRPHLGRNRVLAYGPVTFPHSGVSRMSASVRLMIQGHSARRASSRVRQCHQLIKISEIKSVIYVDLWMHLRYMYPIMYLSTCKQQDTP